MVEETKIQEQEATEEAKVITEEPKKAAAESSGKNRNNRGDRNDTPVEELFDLTKPLKRVEKPDKDGHEKQLLAIEEEIENLKKKKATLQTKIDKAWDSNSNSAASKERDALSALRAKKSALINEKREIRDRLNAMKAKTEKLFDDRKAAKQTVKFTNPKDIEKELRRLQLRQETTSMSLQDEKKLIKEMDFLEKSKKTVASMEDKEVELQNSKEQRKAIYDEITSKDKEIDAVQAEITEKTKVVTSLSEKETNNRGEIDGLFKERETLNEEIKSKHQEKNTLKSAFRVANNEWYSYQRALRAQKKIQYEEERKRREEEKAEYLKKLEEEELKKIPYEEEQALCEYLANYLTVTYLEPLEKASDDATATNGNSKKDVIAVTDDPFANMKPMKKKNDEAFLQMGNGKKPRQRKSKQNKKFNKQAPFKLNMDTFGQFGLIGLTPPVTLEEVPKSVEELVAKKQWYKDQPRGSIPTATEIRRKNEKAAAQVKSGKKGKAASSNGKSISGGAFSLSSDDFAPLGAGSAPSGSSAALITAWGQKGSAESAAEPTPGEAAEPEPAVDGTA
mmetsp:Transcript_37155/g.54659  ORF Transcript_37155/g.54659 Transcript_37155/m.54659 type:complete len:564 (+) Transcript_37155:42-1733(+)|eukprot:CAMPEP_0195518332 /NCGR_PEP_ID=MMETSP0794_2-20130614/12681_1 /TAXON_ID=515487 /ORGANISM="Stephanopyxis turris, Strain CCMP 815" /LENGTH=563 /DNA_ID=CAMNT_0040647275 /DNA_START=41 /DNA_END=1732 /DNA_ORIENTATION=-